MSKRWIALLTGLALVLSVAMTLAQGITPETPWWTFGSGGGHATGENVMVSDTLGQSFVGWSEGGAIDLHAGYWTGLLPPEYGVYLPLVIRMPGEMK